ncbi:MAG: hypothetical protein HYY26_05235 [Acidobacteria bacterium]|nr:hypothetical protein [Acidobacteriota bacterium]
MATIIKRISHGKIPVKKFDRFLKANTKGGRTPRMANEPAGGICGAWGCPLYHRGRRIKRCWKMITSDGRVVTVCEY